MKILNVACVDVNSKQKLNWRFIFLLVKHKDCDDYTVKSLEELKTHIREKHGTAVFIHIKMKRSNYNKVDKKSYYFSKDTNEVEDF